MPNSRKVMVSKRRRNDTSLDGWLRKVGWMEEVLPRKHTRGNRDIMLVQNATL